MICTHSWHATLIVCVLNAFVFLRLPCDERCDKQLACGHRCPGVCGEACPGASYCAHPDCRSKAPSSVLNQVGWHFVCKYMLSRACKHHARLSV